VVSKLEEKNTFRASRTLSVPQPSGYMTAVVRAVTVLNIFCTLDSGGPFQEMALCMRSQMLNAFAVPVLHQLPLKPCK